MILTNLRIRPQRLSDVSGRADAKKPTSGATSGGSAAEKRARVVSETVLADTGRRYPDCTCEDLGLHAGMTIGQLTLLASGCESRWICPRIDSIRRAYGV